MDTFLFILAAAFLAPIAIGVYRLVEGKQHRQRFVKRVEGGFIRRQEILSDWRQFLERPDVLIVDTETTGLGDRAEIVEIAIIDTTGAIQFEALTMPQGRIPKEASDVHGLTRAKLKEEGAKPWPELHAQVTGIIESARVVLAYNADFDSRVLSQTAKRHGLRVPSQPWPWYDLLEDYRTLRPAGRHKLVSATRREKVKVQGQSHRALYDCQCVLGVMRAIANLDERDLEHVKEPAPTRRQMNYISHLKTERKTRFWMSSYTPKTKASASAFIDELHLLPHADEE